jgi:hypothetical protein
MTDADFTRHALATLSYRLGKVLRDAPDSFRDFFVPVHDAAPPTAAGGPEGAERTAGRILAHIGDLMDWALSMVENRTAWKDSQPLVWKEEVARFYAAIGALDDQIAAGGLGASNAEQLFQGPIADALTHTGQLAMMRRLAGVKMKGENYYKAEITTGRVGPDQVAPKREF